MGERLARGRALAPRLQGAATARSIAAAAGMRPPTPRKRGGKVIQLSHDRGFFAAKNERTFVTEGSFMLKRALSFSAVLIALSARSATRAATGRARTGAGSGDRTGARAAATGRARPRDRANRGSAG